MTNNASSTITNNYPVYTTRLTFVLQTFDGHRRLYPVNCPCGQRSSALNVPEANPVSTSSIHHIWTLTCHVEGSSGSVRVIS